MNKTFGALVLCTLLMWSSSLSAEVLNDELICRAPSIELTEHEFLRSLSLDLRGYPPSMEEYETLKELGTVPESLIDEWLDSDDFLERAVVFHQSLLWNNLSNLDMFHRRVTFNKGTGGVYYRRIQAPTYRGERVSCLDEPVSYTESGEIATTKVEDADGNVTFREGWVMVKPYWAPDTEIKVCAFDAQDAFVGKSGKLCSTTSGHNDVTCGCGPELRWCSYNANKTIYSAIENDLKLRVRKIVAENKPYTDLLTDTTMFINGPLSYYLRHHANFAGNVKLLPLSIPKAQIPVLDYTDKNTWVEVKLGADHSGILTSPAFLWRYQTNRSRANKYHVTFLCDPFQPPSGGLGGSDDEEAMITDLQKRPGCKYCHAELEPSASYWSRWPEVGSGLLNSNDYPAFDESCETCALKGGCSSKCNTYYITKALHPSEAEYYGWLKGYLFRSEQHMSNVEKGPRLLVQRTLVDHRLPNCMTKNASRWLLGRTGLSSEKEWFAEVAQSFVSSNFSFKQLVKAIVTGKMYRRVK